MIETKNLPPEPGCYLFRDEKDTIIYVGKAKNIKKRVSSYFQKRHRDAKTGQLVSHIGTVDYIVTANEVEALILENSLIKTHQPRYNIDLKDAKQYAFIHFTAEPFPRIHIARRAEGDGTFFGPFVSAAERDYIFSLVKKLFRLRTCKKMTRRGCLRYHIHTCSAPCRQEIRRDEYAASVKKASMVLKGKCGELISSLKDEMEDSSRSLNFEHAMVLRDQINAIDHLSERQDMSRRRSDDEDIINYRISGNSVFLMLFHVHKGTLAHKQEFVFGHGEEFLEEFLVQFYSDNPVPSEVILPDEVGDVLSDFLAVRLGRKVTVTVPKIGAKKRLLDLVMKNIEISYFGEEIKLEELKEILGLGDLPAVIECFDISHSSGTDVVGSMVRFTNGRPDKKHYRRFKIKTVDGIDDPAAIGEIVRRRYLRLKNEDSPFPDLVIVDGGRTQLGAAAGSLKDLDLTIPVIALAKKNEEVFIPGRAHPLPLARNEKSSHLLQEIRDESHRFAITYHRLLRKKRVIP